MTVTFKIKDGDFVVDVRTGRPMTVADGPKLHQDLQENFEIEVQTSGFGASLESLSGLVGDVFALRSELSRRVRASIQAMQALQARFHRAERPKAERIVKLANLDVAQIVPPGDSQVAKTAYGFRADIVTEDAGQPVAGGGLIIG